jgi:hypothetical protein
MQVTRRAVSTALYNLLTGAYPWAFSEPTARLWGKVPPNQQPYLGLYRPAEDGEQSQAFGLTKWTLYYSVLIYARRDATPDPVGSSFSYFMDDIQDAIDTVMQGPYGGGGVPNTLGGLVTNAWIAGRSDRDEGILDQQGKIEIPVRVIVGI